MDPREPLWQERSRLQREIKIVKKRISTEYRDLRNQTEALARLQTELAKFEEAIRKLN